MKFGARSKTAGAAPRLAVLVPGEALGTRLFWVLSLVAIWCAESQAAGVTPAEQLVRMANALRSLSYEGTIVYLHGSKLEALRVIHRVEDGQIQEQLQSLNGPVRTFTRDNGTVTCDLAGAPSIAVSGHGLGKDLLQAWTLDFSSLRDHYGLQSLGSSRVAGRSADVIGVIPHDGLRYGYRFYLDKQSDLPLKFDLMGDQADPIEQIMFTALEVLPSPGPVHAVASPASEVVTAPPTPVDLSPEPLAWQFVDLPPGFRLVKQGDWLDEDGRRVEHLVLSDGLASVSIYVEGAPKQGLRGSARIGAVHAAGAQVSRHQVTVVGEVPLQTVEAVLAGIRHAPGRHH
jgi:sigma-E factor negative regulatory protein RseB